MNVGEKRLEIPGIFPPNGCCGVGFEPAAAGSFIRSLSLVAIFSPPSEPPPELHMLFVHKSRFLLQLG